jgi:hypothetical protein
MKGRKRVAMALLGVGAMWAFGCDMHGGAAGAMTVAGAAYDKGGEPGCAVYILEGGELVPYLVLTADYGGGALLLREEPLDSPMPYNSYSGYYKGSSIDEYLTGEFTDGLQAEVRGALLDTEITITAESSLGVTGDGVESVSRGVFLLSYTEIGQSGSSIANVEGKPLKYFQDDPGRVVAYKDGEAASWWLRTSYTWGDNSAWGVGPAGTLGGGAVYEPNGVRPALCVDGSLPIEEKERAGAPWAARHRNYM